MHLSGDIMCIYKSIFGVAHFISSECRTPHVCKCANSAVFSLLSCVRVTKASQKSMYLWLCAASQKLTMAGKMNASTWCRVLRPFLPLQARTFLLQRKSNLKKWLLLRKAFLTNLLIWSFRCFFLFPRTQIFLWISFNKHPSKMAERPKRPLSAYMLWLNDNRESIKRENPGIKVTEVAKRGGELWRGLKDKTVSNHFILFFRCLSRHSIKLFVTIFRRSLPFRYGVHFVYASIRWNSY